eukprot:2758351-Rhodomonas_salina.2
MNLRPLLILRRDAPRELDTMSDDLQIISLFVLPDVDSVGKVDADVHSAVVTNLPRIRISVANAYVDLVRIRHSQPACLLGWDALLPALFESNRVLVGSCPLAHGADQTRCPRHQILEASREMFALPMFAILQCCRLLGVAPGVVMLLHALCVGHE